jgi:hypothetical protein
MSAGEVFGPAGKRSKASQPTTTMPAASAQVSRIRAGAILGTFLDSWWMPIRMAGTSTIVVTPFEMLRLRHSTQ